MTPRLTKLVLNVCFYLGRKWTALYFCDILGIATDSEWNFPSKQHPSASVTPSHLDIFGRVIIFACAFLGYGLKVCLRCHLICVTAGPDLNWTPHCGEGKSLRGWWRPDGWTENTIRLQRQPRWFQIYFVYLICMRRVGNDLKRQSTPVSVCIPKLQRFLWG